MTTARWRATWDRWPRKFDGHDHLRQVGKTVDGIPIAHEQIDLIAIEIRNQLRLRPTDVLLDLCCGNGLITARLAKFCHSVVGVDFSRPLIDIARRDHMPANVSYHIDQVPDLDGLPALDRSFTRILMYDALQYFGPEDLQGLLIRLDTLADDDCLMMFGGVPHRPDRMRLHGSAWEKFRYAYYRLTGRDRLGSWWRDEDFRRATAQAGREYRLHRQRPDLYNASFRVDVTIW